jgi:hypothetical protein
MEVMVLITIIANYYATKYVDISVHYEHYSDFAKINNNGTIGKGVGQVVFV